MKVLLEGIMWVKINRIEHHMGRRSIKEKKNECDDDIFQEVDVHEQ